MDYTFWLGRDGDPAPVSPEDERALENSPLYPGVGLPK